MPVHFDGTDARISTTDSVGAPTALPYGMACVARFDAVSRWHGLLSLAANNVTRGFEWEIDNSNRMFHGDNGTGGSRYSTGVVAASTWYFLGTAVTTTLGAGIRHFCYNLQTNAIVFDETFTGDAWVYGAPNAGEDYTLGAWASTSTSFGDFMDGIMAWMAVYNININSTSAMFALATLGPYALGAPVAFWPLLDGVDGATSTTAQEWANRNTGTLTNINFDANGGWRPMSLPGPWWNNQRAQVIRPKAAAPAKTTKNTRAYPLGIRAGSARRQGLVR